MPQAHHQRAAVPADARPHAKVRTVVCTKWRHGTCVKSHTVWRSARAMPHQRYRVGYVFGPNYAYTSVTDLPAPAVTYYHLGTTERYVYNDGYIYVIDPTTYAVTRVIDTFSH